MYEDVATDNMSNTSCVTDVSTDHSAQALGQVQGHKDETSRPLLSRSHQGTEE